MPVWVVIRGAKTMMQYQRGTQIAFNAGNVSILDNQNGLVALIPVDQVERAQMDDPQQTDKAGPGGRVR